MTAPYVTAVYAALLGLLAVALSTYVMANRRRAGISLGEGGDAGLQRAIRVFGNFTEYVPTALILIGLLEACGGARLWLHILGAALLTGRVAHAVGLASNAGASAGRNIGVLLTNLTLIGAAVALLVVALPKL
jgi:uncharacterized membrane protein YecN with MAPEG domain